MNSQNKMNAGAEYVLYRIWATLQDEDGIHAESLLTCLGALAGYSCQACARHSAALAGADADADPAKYSLTTLTSSNGTAYFGGVALNRPLTESPLSVWALIRRAVQKLGKPVPDLEEISTQVTQTLGTSAFGIPRAPDGNAPRHRPIVYLKQLWPQILPIAQRFCRRPGQLPVLFGIAIQRTIELMQHRLSPTLGASIAMESALAMSMVALPELPNAWTVAVPVRAVPVAKKKPASAVESKLLSVGAFIERIPVANSAVAIAVLAALTVGGAMWKTDRRAEAPPTAREERTLSAPAGLQSSVATLDQPIPERPAIGNEPPPERVLPPSQVADVPNSTLQQQPSNEYIITEGEYGVDSSRVSSAAMLTSAQLAEL